MRQTTFKLDAVRHCGQPEDTCAGREEVTSVVVRVEADEVAVEHAEEYFLTDGEDAAFCRR